MLGMFAPVALAMNAMMQIVSSIGNAIREYFNAGQAFVDWGKKANISAQSVAYLKAQADSAGVSTKEFERAMDDLASGKTSIEKLRKEWQGLGDDIKTASNAQQNFSELGRKKNFENFGEGWNTLWGGLANEGLEMVGFGGKARAIVEAGAYSGKTFEEALFEAQKGRRGWHAPINVKEMKTAYYTALANKTNDELETKQRNREYTAQQLAKADLSASDREKIFFEQTKQHYTNDEIIALADSLKTNEDKLADEIKRATEAQKERDQVAKENAEREKREKEKKDKLADEMAKTAFAIKDSFTAGGGLIGGAGYSIRNQSGMEAMTAVAEKQLKTQQKQVKTLEDLRTILKGE
jgi:hypothetical protein